MISPTMVAIVWLAFLIRSGGNRSTRWRRGGQVQWLTLQDAGF